MSLHAGQKSLLASTHAMPRVLLFLCAGMGVLRTFALVCRSARGGAVSEVVNPVVHGAHVAAVACVLKTQEGGLSAQVSASDREKS